MEFERTGSSTTEATDEKRVEILLWRLEEAIACGQFDKAAVLAKELAAIKRPAAAVNNSTVTVANPVVLKPVAAPRSILPAVKPAAPLPDEAPSIANKNQIKSPPPRPAKRHSITEPVPVPPPKNTPSVVRPEEIIKPEEPIAVVPVPVETPVIQQVLDPPAPAPAPSVVTVKVNPVPVIPEASVRSKRSKVSSGQQTTLTYQRKSTGPAILEQNKVIISSNKERSQSCIIDDTFKYTLPVRPN